jgi:hypothetical protein
MVTELLMNQEIPIHTVMASHMRQILVRMGMESQMNEKLKEFTNNFFQISWALFITIGSFIVILGLVIWQLMIWF